MIRNTERHNRAGFAAGFLIAGILALLSVSPAAAEDAFTVELSEVRDTKTVFATVETADVVAARVRSGGTVSRLTVDEGATVTEGQVIAKVTDPKLELRLSAVEERAQSAQSQLNLAATALERARKLRASGTISQSRLDEAETNLQVRERELAAVRAEKSVISQQQVEGDVLAPAAGRVLKVHVTAGTVVLPGESIATIAAQGYVLRMRLPERHARYLAVGQEVHVADRNADGAPRIGRVTQVYPELEHGRLVADIEVEDLGGYFVGERVAVELPTGTRHTFVVPTSYLFTRFGVTFVRLRDGGEVVVQPGRATGAGVEILSGLEAGDVIVSPAEAK